jgi:hypothetical protein
MIFVSTDFSIDDKATSRQGAGALPLLKFGKCRIILLISIVFISPHGFFFKHGVQRITYGYF